jgi:poly(A) polymerase
MESRSPAGWPNETASSRFAIEVVERLRSAGFQALWAGGCVRDLILGLQPSDYDVATDAVPERVMDLFRRTVPVGLSFGVVRVLGPVRGVEIEVATFRSDGRYLDGRRPEDVRFGTAADDAVRRDFTINGIFFDPIANQVIDYVGGQADLDAGIVRAIGDPRQRFEEDKLRLLRAVRFAARFGFQIEARTRQAIESLGEEIRVVAVERIAQELIKILQHPTRAEGVHLAHQTGLLRTILPEVDQLYDRTEWQGVLHESPSLGQHVERVLARLPRDPLPSPALALAALLHELGRAEVAGDAEITRDSQGLRRDDVGARRALEVAMRLRLSNDDRNRVSWLVEHHAALADVQALSPAVRKRLLSRPGIAELIALHRADAEAEGRSTRPVDFADDYRSALPEGPLDPPPLVNGNDLGALGIVPGPIFKALLECVRDAQLNGLVSTKEEALAWLQSQTRAGSEPDCA